MSSGMTKNSRKNIRFCGTGGMGVILTSIILGKAAIYDGKYAIQTQSYGAEQRGSKVKSDVMISDKEIIDYPLYEKADILVSFSKDAFEFYYQEARRDALHIINSNLIQSDKSKENIIEIPSINLALEVGNKRTANIIMLGALIKIENLVSRDSIIKSINDSVPKQFREINIEAFQIGYEYILKD